MRREEFVEKLDANKALQADLFIRGFLITNTRPDISDKFPFYGNWTTVEEGAGFYFTAHKLTGNHIYTADDGTVHFLMGHAYDPFSMEHREKELLKELAKVYGTPEYMERIHDLTGVFVLGAARDGIITYLVDPSGMQSAACGVINNSFYLSSHAQLIGDLCTLTMDPFVKELVEYKWYHRVMGSYLPADLTPFKEVKRVVPSNMYKYDGIITHKRFWPTENLSDAEGEEYTKVIKEAAEILKRNMLLISRKWEDPWISLTGGIDSNTTFAAANGLYGQFKTFSYVSAPKEEPDANAAEEISNRFGVEHRVYTVPECSSTMADYELIAQILRHNNGYIVKRKDSETRKRVFLRQHLQCQVEVKSWTSETIRGYWYKHYGRKSMPPLSAKLYRNLYKIFLFNRRLARKVDSVFETYLATYEYYDIPRSYPPADIHFNEVTWGSWGSLNISEMKYICDLTIPYNNRRLLDLLFRVPLSKRIADEHHLDMKKLLNRELYDMNIRVINMEETDKRAFLLNLIFTINSILPF